MAVPLVPYVPDFITVHLGNPDENAQNVIVSFPDYIKNVASSEIYPTWSESAIYANIYAQISYALNRVYTNYYRSRGYDFDITSSPSLDQKFIYGRNIYENIDAIVNDIFTSYIRRIGNIEPLAAKYCNGTTTTCDGLSQWGSEELGQMGYSAFEILKYYYGDNIELVDNAPIVGIISLYPGEPIRLGDQGANVSLIQEYLNVVSGDYPLIPKINPVNGIFDENTQNSVVTFQEIFNLTPDGIVGRATWNKLLLLYNGISKLSELVSEGVNYNLLNIDFPDTTSLGDTGARVSTLQYFLLIISNFDPRIPGVNVDGDFGTLTKDSVIAFQNAYGLNPTGVVDTQTWELLYDTYSAIINVLITTGINPDNIPRQTQYSGSELSYGDSDN